PTSPSKSHSFNPFSSSARSAPAAIQVSRNFASEPLPVSAPTELSTCAFVGRRRLFGFSKSIDRVPAPPWGGFKGGAKGLREREGTVTLPVTLSRNISCRFRLFSTSAAYRINFGDTI